MSFWTHHMPAGMWLRSPQAATDLADPARALTLDAYQAACATAVSTPLPLETFVAYGRWFQQRAVPQVDPRTVLTVVPDAGGFRLILDEGEACQARRVVVAAGIAPFALSPPVFGRLPGALVSHVSEHTDLTGFAGQQVLVVGGGQSALESAALICEAGGDVELAIRARMIRWLHRRPWMHRDWIGALLYAPPDVGPAGISHVVARPGLFRRMPRMLQDQFGPLSIRPAGAAWLKPRCEKIPLNLGCSVTSAVAVGGRVSLTLSDGTERRVDHVLLGTGYRVDIARYPFLASALLESIRRTDGYPELDAGFECSVRGLHFVGAPAAWSFGPLMRFVAGCRFASRALLDRIAPSPRQAAPGGVGPSARTAKPPHRVADARSVFRYRWTPQRRRDVSSVGRHGRAFEARHVGAVVTGADYRGLGLARSLGRAGVPVVVLTHDDQLLAAFSRYVRQRQPWRGGDDAERVRVLVDLATREGLHDWVLFPTDDDAVSLVSRHHDVLAEHFRLTTPPWNELRWAVDKRLLHQLALRLDLDQPWAHLPAHRHDLPRVECPYPVIVKPARRERLNRLTADKAWLAADALTLRTRFDEACAVMDPDSLLIQEFIPGGSDAQLSYSAVCIDGRPVASVLARRTRQFPMDFGRASTYVETVEEEPAIVAASVRLLRALAFTGMVEIEYKRDARDGRYKVLDVNPRVWGWQSLGARAGVDFPLLLWRHLMGEVIPEQRGRAGVRWMRMTTDLSPALGEILGGRLSPAAYLSSFRPPVESAIFALDDPCPGLLELPLMAYLLARRRLRGKASPTARVA
jgi:predicted ATP-grasp superfamily ATP-dependent carboligase/cation diffusion facilitator CzcD-associated flavoprotein CzcO